MTPPLKYQSIAAFLPWPPSVNHYYGRAKGGRIYIKKDGLAYREMVAIIGETRGWKPFDKDDRLKVEITAYPPDRRKRDLDNILKAMIDAIQASGLIPDDEAIDSLCIERNSRASCEGTPGVDISIEVVPETDVGHPWTTCQEGTECHTKSNLGKNSSPK